MSSRRTSAVRTDAKLDLHGMTLAAAHRAVIAFVQQAHRDELRCIEIITGRGDPEHGTGALKREVPLWLELPPLNHFISQVQMPAVSRGGSYRVMLRRSKIKN
jgi:DNA-nicking Smr family endonuclease